MTVALICLAVYRVTRFVTADAFPAMVTARESVARRWGDDSWQTELAGCPWCVSIYVGAVVVVATILVGVSVPVPGLVWLTASAVTGLIAAFEP